MGIKSVGEHIDFCLQSEDIKKKRHFGLAAVCLLHAQVNTCC